MLTKEKGIERERLEALYLQIHSPNQQNSQMSCSEAGSQAILQILPVWALRPKGLSHHPLLSPVVNRELDLKWKSLDENQYPFEMPAMAAGKYAY